MLTGAFFRKPVDLNQRTLKEIGFDRIDSAIGKIPRNPTDSKNVCRPSDIERRTPQVAVSFKTINSLPNPTGTPTGSERRKEIRAHTKHSETGI